MQWFHIVLELLQLKGKNNGLWKMPIIQSVACQDAVDCCLKDMTKFILLIAMVAWCQDARIVGLSIKEIKKFTLVSSSSAFPWCTSASMVICCKEKPLTWLHLLKFPATITIILVLELSPGWSRWAKPPCQSSPLARRPLQAGTKSRSKGETKTNVKGSQF